MAGYYDVFNGDADGICALHQLRLAEPRPAAGLITGVKRDSRLLAKIAHAKNAAITVLDISLDTNRQKLAALLTNGCHILYIDHHYAGLLPEPAAGTLETHIDPSPDTCTSLIVDRLLEGRYRAWAAAGAFGDNLHEAGAGAAAALSLSSEETGILKELGELLNYNGYGLTIEDLHFHPEKLYRAVAPFADPFAFWEKSAEMEILRAGFRSDMEKTAGCQAANSSEGGRVFILPAEAWARRTVGVFSNDKAREKPDLAHAILVKNNDRSFRVSVRAPLARQNGADSLCRQFSTGGGRAAAAGINALPEQELDRFIEKFTAAFSRT